MSAQDATAMLTDAVFSGAYCTSQQDYSKNFTNDGRSSIA